MSSSTCTLSLADELNELQKALSGETFKVLPSLGLHRVRSRHPEWVKPIYPLGIKCIRFCAGAAHFNTFDYMYYVDSHYEPCDKVIVVGLEDGGQQQFTLKEIMDEAAGIEPATCPVKSTIVRLFLGHQL